MTIVRFILGVLAGIALGLGVVMAGDYVNHMLWPPPPEVQAANPEAIRAYMATAPILSLLGLPVTWTIAALAASFAAAKIAGRVGAGWIAGAALFAATALNLAFIPHPLWMLIAALVFVPLAGFLGARIAAPRAVG